MQNWELYHQHYVALQSPWWVFSSLRNGSWSWMKKCVIYSYCYFKMALWGRIPIFVPKIIFWWTLAEFFSLNFWAKNSLLIIGQKMEFLFQCVMMVIKLALKLTVWFLREDCSVLTSRIWCAFWMYREAQLPKKRQKCSHYCHFKHNDKTPPTILSSLHLNSRIE